MAIFAGKRVAQTGDAKVSDFKDFKEREWEKKPAFQLRTKLGSRVHSSDIGEAVKQQGPDIALELAWKSRNMDFAMPYLIQAGIIEGQLANNLHLFSVYWDFTKAIFC